MKNIRHPRLADISLAEVLDALGDPIRLKILKALDEVPEISCHGSVSNRQTPKTSIPKSTLSHHFRIMRDAGLVQSVKDGVTSKNSIRREDLNARFPGLLDLILELDRADSPAKTTRNARKKNEAD